MASTLKQIAEVANVSRGTVDRVIHGRYGVDPKTRACLLAVMQDLDYKPNAMAQALRGMQNAFRIGAIVPSEANPFYIDVNSGIDILNPVQTTAAGMDARMLKEQWGDKFVFWGGGINTLQTLPFGTPEECYNEAMERLEIFAPSGGFVFNTVHNIQGQTPMENMLAMFQAVKDYNAKIAK